MLLETVLLVLIKRGGMSATACDYFCLTSNDLLHKLKERHSPQSGLYTIIAQCADDVRNVENAPAVSMGPYLLGLGRLKLLTTISVYSQRGETREQLRLIYMNEVALRIWREMGRSPNVIGSQTRPPRGALLTFGVPFSV